MRIVKRGGSKLEVSGIVIGGVVDSGDRCAVVGGGIVVCVCVHIAPHSSCSCKLFAVSACSFSTQFQLAVSARSISLHCSIPLGSQFFAVSALRAHLACRACRDARYPDGAPHQDLQRDLPDQRRARLRSEHLGPPPLPRS